jgi:predicted aspartyl protease
MGTRALFVTVLVTMSVVAAAGADRTPAAVPLSIDAKGGIVVDVRINGAGPFRFILDTGTARSIVADDLARQLAAPAVAKSDVVTSTGSDLRLVVRLASLTMASATAHDLSAAVVPAVQLARLGHDVRGLLGQDFLSAFNYTLDYRRRRLTWDERLSCDAPGAARMTAADGRFVMALEDDNGEPLRLVPDSGAEVAVLFRARAGRARGSTAPAAMVTGLGSGERTASLATMPTLRVGSVTMRHLDAYIIERPDSDVDGLLPLHGFSSVSFAAGGACLVARR